MNITNDTDAKRQLYDQYGAASLDPNFEPPVEIDPSAFQPQPSFEPSFDPYRGSAFVPPDPFMQPTNLFGTNPIPQPSTRPTFYPSSSSSSIESQEYGQRTWMFNLFSANYSEQQPQPQYPQQQQPLQQQPLQQQPLQQQPQQQQPQAETIQPEPTQPLFSFTVYPVETVSTAYAPFEPTPNLFAKPPSRYDAPEDDPELTGRQFVPIQPIPAIYTQPAPATQIYESPDPTTYAIPTAQMYEAPEPTVPANYMMPTDYTVPTDYTAPTDYMPSRGADFAPPIPIQPLWPNPPTTGYDQTQSKKQFFGSSSTRPVVWPTAPPSRSSEDTRPARKRWFSSTRTYPSPPPSSIGSDQSNRKRRWWKLVL
jgi:hypothetical protein